MGPFTQGDGYYPGWWKEHTHTDDCEDWNRPALYAYTLLAVFSLAALVALIAWLAIR